MSASGALHLLLFGGKPRLASGGLAHQIGAKAENLLVLVAGASKPILRRQAAHWLWPASSSQAGRHSLSQCLYTLRRGGFGPFLQIDPDRIGLARECRTDVHAFRKAIHSADAAAAAAAYQGVFAADVEPVSSPLEDWLLATRLELHLQARGVAFQLRDQFRVAEALQLTQHLLAFDPADLEIQALQDDLTSAVGTPKQLAVRLHDGEGFAEGELRGPRDMIEASGSPYGFIGRDAELAALAQYWDQVKRGQFTRVALVGEAGIGKTALMQRFQRVVALKGGTSAWATAHALEKNVAFGIVAQWLASLARDQPPRADSYIAELLAPRTVASGAGGDLPPEFESALVARLRIFTALADEFEYVVRGKPLCLIVDDMDCADDASLAFLQFLARRLGVGPLLFCGTLREDGAEGGIPEGLKGFEVVRVSPFSRGETATLFRRAFPSLGSPHGDSEAIKKIYSRTGGNPLLLLSLINEGVVTPEGSDEVPRSIVAFFRPRLARLSAQARATLAALAVAPYPTLSTLQRITGYSDIAYRSALRELEEQRFVDGDGHRVRAHHGLVAEVALSSVGPAAERQLRGRAARFSQEEGSSSSASLAVQFDLAGHRERAHHAALRAATAAEDLFAHQEAEYFLKIALMNVSGREAAAEIRSRLADLYLSQGKYPQAAAVLEEAGTAELASAVNEKIRAHQMIVRLVGLQDGAVVEEGQRFASQLGPSLPVELKARFMMALASAAHAQGRRSTVVAATESTIELCRHVSSPQLRLRLAVRAGALIAMYRSARDGIRHINTVITEAALWPDTLALAYGARGSARIAAGLSDEAEQDLLAAIELMESTGSYDGLFMVTNNLGVLYQEQGRFSEALQQYERALGSRTQLEVPSWAQVTMDNMVILKYEMEDWDGAIEIAERAIRQFSRSDISARSWLSQHSIKGLCSLELGQRIVARECRREVELALRRLEYGSNDISYIESFLARMLEIEGQTSTAIGRLEKAIAAFRDRDFFSTARMEVERLRLLAKVDPEEVLVQAPVLRRSLQKAKAVKLIDRLDAVVARAQTAAAKS